jgi:hypothetical protein
MSQRRYKTCKLLLQAFFILLVHVTLWREAAGQSKASIKGIIIDVKSRKPVSFATVFLANTSFGTESAENGTFRIDKISPGKYDLIVSLVGYEKVLRSIEVSTSNVVLELELTAQVTQLREVVVEVGDWKKYYKIFERYFLGQTPHAKKCVIKNPDDIFLTYDEDTKTLKAEADKPIIVENPALGYTVYYLLSQFEYDEKEFVIRVFGIPRFEDLQPKNERQARHWKNERDLAYLGSVKHFMQSLVKRELKKNKFLIYREGEDTPLKESSLFADSTSRQLNFKGRMKVIYNGEVEDYAYRQFKYRGPQTSIIKFMDEKITIYDNGYFEDPKSVMLDGYLAWAESLASLVPLAYELNKKR